MTNLKEAIRAFWDRTPCGTADAIGEEGTVSFFSNIERARYEREPFIRDFARFQDAKGLRVLEVGFGAGTDFIQFARHGAVMSGVDLTEHGASLLRRRLSIEGLSADVRVADAESLPFADNTFDVVYSWGVIHHTEDTPRAAREIVRVVKPGGRICVMVYHRHSLFALQYWLVYGLLAGRPQRSFAEVVARHVESAGTKAYTLDEARELFAPLPVEVTPVVTCYDARVGRRLFLPRWTHSLIPSRCGWFLVIEGTKPL